jgi:hypothetical protein
MATLSVQEQSADIFALPDEIGNRKNVGTNRHGHSVIFRETAFGRRLPRGRGLRPRTETPPGNADPDLDTRAGRGIIPAFAAGERQPIAPPAAQDLLRNYMGKPRRRRKVGSKKRRERRNRRKKRR